MKTVKFLLSNLTIILSLMFVVLYIVNECNPSMAFLSSRVSRYCLLGFCLSSILTAAFYIYDQCKKKK